MVCLSAAAAKAAKGKKGATPPSEPVEARAVVEKRAPQVVFLLEVTEEEAAARMEAAAEAAADEAKLASVTTVRITSGVRPSAGSPFGLEAREGMRRLRQSGGFAVQMGPMTELRDSPKRTTSSPTKQLSISIHIGALALSNPPLKRRPESTHEPRVR